MSLLSDYKPIYKKVPNELVPNFLGLAAILPMPCGDSPSRIQMVMSQIAQNLVIKGAEAPHFNSGIEQDLANYTFNVKAPENLTIKAIIPRYRQSMGGDGFVHNPETVVIYHGLETDRINALVLPDHFSAHHHFGFKYVPRYDSKRFHPGGYFDKGEVFCESPGIDDEGNYCYGTELTIAHVSAAGVIEDGSIIREGAMDKLNTKGYEKRIITFGRKTYPCNLFGTKDFYKIVPDIGESVREDGILCALREYDPICDIVNMMPGRTRQVDFIHDQKTFVVSARPCAKVIDVRVEHSPRRRGPSLPEGMDSQLKRYLHARDTFNHKLWDVYSKLGGHERDRRIGLEFSNMLTKALGETIEADHYNVKNTLKGEILDEWFVEVTFEYDVPFDIGNKITDRHGGKTVICQKIKDEDALYLADGTPVDLMVDGNSRTKRMNTAAAMEVNINSSRMAAERVLKQIAGDGKDPEKRRAALSFILDFLSIAAPTQYRAFIGHENPLMTDLLDVPPVDQRPAINWDSFLDYTLEHGFYISSPTCIPEEHLDIMENLETYYPPLREHLRFKNKEGEIEYTYNKILVGSMYIWRLEKTGQDWSAVSTARLQHFGIPAKLTNFDKYSDPIRQMPVRLIDESTGRLLAAMVGGDVVVKEMEQSNNPTLHRAIRRKLLLAEDPSNVYNINNRAKENYGNSRSVQLANQMLECAGISFRRHKNPGGYDETN